MLRLRISLSILLIAVLCESATAQTCGERQLPVRVVMTAMEKSALDAFLERIREFADQEQFAIRIGQSGPNKEDATVILWRTDVKVLGGNASDTGARNLRFDLGLYKTCEYPVPGWSFDRVAKSLHRALSTVAGVRDVTIQ